MAIVRAIASGNWSNTAIWNTGALPTSNDDVYSNTYTITIDQNVTVLSISNASATGVTAGGGFTVSANGLTITCTGTGITAGSGANVHCITSNLTAGNTLTIVSNVTGGSASGVGVLNNSSGTVNITGNALGGSSNPSYAVLNNSTGAINLTGNATGGSQANSNAVRNGSTGTVVVVGTATAGSNTSFGIDNASTGTFTHTGTVQATGHAAVQGLSASGTLILSGPFLTNNTGVNPVYALRWFWANSNVTPTYYQIRTANLATIRPLYTADSVGGNPAASNVRSGTVYGPAGELTGTCAVPGASSVLSGVPVDNTTGTATISAASIRSALGLASANLDSQLAAIPTTAAPSAATVAAAVWASLTSGLSTVGTVGKLLVDQLDAAISTRSTYAGGDTSGTTTLLSRLTSGRAGNLDNLDATVSSRLASASYSAPLDAAGTRSAVGLATGNLDTQLSGISSGISGLPSASAIASAVWAAATRTLTTAIDNSSTIAAAVWSYATGRTITGGTVDTLTNAPSVPSAAAIASQVRTELSVELGRIDATVSSRLAPSGTLARVTLTDTVTTVTNSSPVDAGEIAEAVRTELAPELAHLDADVSSRQATLARLQNVATTQEVGDIVEGALGD